jgi:hypothetical protein
MQTVEIPRGAWVRRLNEFTDAHDRCPISLEILGADLGAQPEIDNVPLLGVSADRTDHDGTIAVSVARSASEHLTHIIRAVTRIYVERTDDGADAALQIESADGTRTILRVRPDARSAPVAGVALR